MTYITQWLLRIVVILSIFMGINHTGHAEEIGSVRTKFRLLTPNDTIAVEAFDDPKIAGIHVISHAHEKAAQQAFLASKKIVRMPL